MKTSLDLTRDKDDLGCISVFPMLGQKDLFIMNEAALLSLIEDGELPTENCPKLEALFSSLFTNELEAELASVRKDFLALQVVNVALKKDNKDLKGENRELEKATLRIRQELSSNQDLKDLLQGKVHDINNNISTILAFLEKIKENPDPKSIKDMEAMIYNLSDLFTSLVNFMKNSNQDPICFYLNNTFEKKILPFLQAISKNANVNFKCVSLKKEDLVLIKAIPLNLMSVFHNIAKNAIEAMEDSSTVEPQLNLNIEKVEIKDDQGCLTDGPYIKFSFTDNGPGIASEVLPEIFKIHFSTKGKNGDVAKKGGSGLGLWGSLGLICKYNGDIRVSSNNQGTTFDVLLPILQENNLSEQECYEVSIQESSLDDDS